MDCCVVSGLSLHLISTIARIVCKRSSMHGRDPGSDLPTNLYTLLQNCQASTPSRQIHWHILPHLTAATGILNGAKARAWPLRTRYGDLAANCMQLLPTTRSRQHNCCCMARVACYRISYLSIRSVQSCVQSQRTLPAITSSRRIRGWYPKHDIASPPPLPARL
jgi:hypothetical protein